MSDVVKIANNNKEQLDKLVRDIKITLKRINNTSNRFGYNKFIEAIGNESLEFILKYDALRTALISIGDGENIESL